MNDFDYLAQLPGEGREQSWIQRRLETLDVREATALAAATQRMPPEDTAQAINTLQSLDEYKVHFPVGSYEELGRLHLKQDFDVPEEVLPHVDFDKLGRQYEAQHPGLFVGNCYVEYPETTPEPVCQPGGPLPRDNGWSVKMKVASPAVPEGVWVRLPFPNGWEDSCYQCESLVLETLGVSEWTDCTLLEALCILPEAGKLMEQYDNVADLICDGQNLGYVLLEQGQGTEGWREKFAAALELESCRDLRLALDISQNLRCYEWIPGEGLADFAAEHLRSCHVSDELIQSGCIDLDGHAEDLLESSGYIAAKEGAALKLKVGDATLSLKVVADGDEDYTTANSDGAFQVKANDIKDADSLSNVIATIFNGGTDAAGEAVNKIGGQDFTAEAAGGKVIFTQTNAPTEAGEVVSAGVPVSVTYDRTKRVSGRPRHPGRRVDHLSVII